MLSNKEAKRYFTDKFLRDHTTSSSKKTDQLLDAINGFKRSDKPINTKYTINEGDYPALADQVRQHNTQYQLTRGNFVPLEFRGRRAIETLLNPAEGPAPLPSVGPAVPDLRRKNARVNVYNAPRQMNVGSSAAREQWGPPERFKSPGGTQYVKVGHLGPPEGGMLNPRADAPAPRRPHPDRTTVKGLNERTKQKIIADNMRKGLPPLTDIM